jgi:hypothetical protein
MRPKKLFKLACSFEHAAETLQLGFDGTAVGEAGTTICGAAHEQVALAGGGQRHFLRAEERVRVARQARRLSALAHGLLLFHHVDG